MKKILIMLVVLLSANLISADTLMGQVSDSDSGEAIAGVSVYIKNSNKGIITDKDGKFTITSLEPGEYNVIFQRLDYKILEQVINFPDDRILNIKMLKKPTEIEGMKVSDFIGTDTIKILSKSN